MSLAKASVWTSFSVLTKILCGLLVVKLMAISYGPQGLGLAGNFRQLITVLGVIAGAGIFNGVTRYVAEHQQHPQQLRQLTSAATALVLIASLLMATLLLLAAAPLSTLLFGSDHYQGILRLLALLQAGIGWANLLQALLKGFRDARGNALVVALGSLLGVASYLLCWKIGGYQGALTGLALVPAMALLPALWLLTRRTAIKWRWLIPQWHPQISRDLLKYTVMAIMTAVTLPVVWVVMRRLLAAHTSWQQVGLWQGVSTLSDAWLQFITATFSVWLLPTLSRLTDKREIAMEMRKALCFYLPLVAGIALSVWLLRDIAIHLLFSSQFTAMRDLFFWQLTGDFFKVGAYIFGYLVIARASLRLYLLTELSQFILLLTSSWWLIPQQGVQGAVEAYALSYTVYFCLCAAVFMFWYRK